MFHFFFLVFPLAITHHDLQFHEKNTNLFQTKDQKIVIQANSVFDAVEFSNNLKTPFISNDNDCEKKVSELTDFLSKIYPTFRDVFRLNSKWLASGSKEKAEHNQMKDARYATMDELAMAKELNQKGELFPQNT